MTGPEAARARPAKAGAAPRWLGLLLYPFVMLAVWINLFMLSLLGTWLGLPSLSTLQSLIAAAFVALPADYAATRWVEGLLARAQEP